MDKEIIDQLIKVLEYVEQIIPHSLDDEFGDECVPALIEDLKRR